MENTNYPINSFESKYKKVLKLSFELGTLLLSYGAEMYRVETSIGYVCRAYGIDNISAFSTPTLLVITIGHSEQNYTLSGRIKSIHTDLDRVEKLNALSVRICRDSLSLDEAFKEIEHIKALKSYSFKMKILSYFLISSAFSVFFGSTLLDGLIAGIVSFFILIISTIMDKFDLGFFFSALSCSLAISFICKILGILSIITVVNSSQIGLLMLIVPGIAITNCMREFISGELMTGCEKLVEAFLTATAIAIGVVLAGLLVSFL